MRERAAQRLDLWSSIGGDRWSSDSRDGTFPGRCGAGGFNEPEGNERHALPFLPSLVEWPSHGPWSCRGRERSTRAQVKVKGPTMSSAECHRERDLPGAFRGNQRAAISPSFALSFPRRGLSASSGKMRKIPRIMRAENHNDFISRARDLVVVKREISGSLAWILAELCFNGWITRVFKLDKLNGRWNGSCFLME